MIGTLKDSHAEALRSCTHPRGFSRRLPNDPTTSPRVQWAWPRKSCGVGERGVNISVIQTWHREKEKQKNKSTEHTKITLLTANKHKTAPAEAQKPPCSPKG